MLPYLRPTIIRQGSRESIQRPPLHLGGVAIEMGVFGSPSTKIDNLITY